MAGIPPSPRFFQQPLRYLKWASINKPAYFYSIIVGLTGPVMVLTVPPIRRYMGEEQIPKIPLTYPSTYCSWRGGGCARLDSGRASEMENSGCIRGEWNADDPQYPRDHDRGQRDMTTSREGAMGKCEKERRKERA